MSETIQAKGGKARAEKLTPDERSRVAQTAAEARWGAKIPRASHAGSLRIGDAEIECAVLENGRRVLTQDTFLRAIGKHGNPKRPQKDYSEVPPFLDADNLKPFISDELRVSSRPLKFRVRTSSGWGGFALGYDATVLPAVCKVFLDARDAGALKITQKHIARTADLLIRGLATVGIVALIDEATGYQQERDRDELHKILAAYISEELLPWTRRFPSEFYKEMFRLRGWPMRPVSTQGPRYAGKLTNILVYERLPPGVLAELKSKNPAENGQRKHRHHQFLTDDIGNPHLEKQVAAVTTLMKAAPDWDSFQAMFQRVFPLSGEQMRLMWPVEETDV